MCFVVVLFSSSDPGETVAVADRVIVFVNGVPTRIDITQEMRTACESIVPPIVETIVRLGGWRG